MPAKFKASCTTVSFKLIMQAVHDFIIAYSGALVAMDCCIKHSADERVEQHCEQLVNTQRVDSREKMLLHTVACNYA